MLWSCYVLPMLFLSICQNDFCGTDANLRLCLSSMYACLQIDTRTWCNQHLQLAYITWLTLLSSKVTSCRSHIWRPETWFRSNLEICSCLASQIASAFQMQSRKSCRTSVQRWLRITWKLWWPSINHDPWFSQVDRSRALLTVCHLQYDAWYTTVTAMLFNLPSVVIWQDTHSHTLLWSFCNSCAGTQTNHKQSLRGTRLGPK